MEQEDYNSRSMLEDIHFHLLHSAKAFRELVCQECGWSEGTFYRKLASLKGLSPAVRQKVLEMGEYVVNKLLECIKEHQSRR